jgi:hypothetical protein
MSMIRPRAPRDLVAALEARPVLREGAGERVSGYGVHGVHFASGEVLELRRFAASSVGPACTSVWHYCTSGRWTLYQDVPEAHGCGRYFSDGVHRVVVTPIRIVWSGAARFTVTVEAAAFEWQVELTSTWVTRVLDRLVRALPRGIVTSRPGGAILGRIAEVLLGTGVRTLTGRTPNGFRYLAAPTTIYRVGGSRALIGGGQTGEAIDSARDLRLGTVRIPPRGIFAMAATTFRPGPETVAGSSGT